MKRGDSSRLEKKNKILAKQRKSKRERIVRGNWHPRKKPPRPSFNSFLLSLKFKPPHHQGLRINLRVQIKQEKVSSPSFDID